MLHFFCWTILVDQYWDVMKSQTYRISSIYAFHFCDTHKFYQTIYNERHQSAYMHTLGYNYTNVTMTGVGVCHCSSIVSLQALSFVALVFHWCNNHRYLQIFHDQRSLAISLLKLQSMNTGNRNKGYGWFICSLCILIRERYLIK